MLTTDCTAYQLSELGNKGGLMGYVETRVGEWDMWKLGGKVNCMWGGSSTVRYSFS